MASVGILGGTFNPPHIGHLVCAQEARAQLHLDRVVLMPVHTAPHKAALDDPGPEARLALCQAAIAGDEELEISALEIERGGSSYTVDTLRALHGSREGDDLTFIVGGDMASSLPSWREPEALLELARVAVAEREEHRRQEIAERLGGLRGAGERIVFAAWNSEITAQWLLMAIRAGYSPAWPRLEAFLIGVGRRKFVKPLFEALVKTPDGKARAKAIYAKARPVYHPITQATVDAILK